MTAFASSAASSFASGAGAAAAVAAASRFGSAAGGANSAAGGSASGSAPGAFAASLAEASSRPAAAGGADSPVGGARLSASALNTRSEAQTRAAIHKSAADFETSAMGQLLGFMTQNVEVDPNFGGGHGEEMFRDMMNTEYGKIMHKAGRSGLADQVERQLLRAQGLKPLPGPSAKG